MPTVIRIVGVLLVLSGIIWILQGVNVLPGSFMTGQTKWAVNGAIALVIGVVVYLWGSRMAAGPRAGG